MESTKEELESHLAQTYNDPRREEELPPFPGLKKPTRPGLAFNMTDLKKKEVDDFIKKARTKSCPGNDGQAEKAAVSVIETDVEEEESSREMAHV